MRTYLTLDSRGLEYKITFHAGKVNPFHITVKYWKQDKYDYPTKHTKTVEKYADLKSCLLWLVDNVPNTEG